MNQGGVVNYIIQAPKKEVTIKIKERILFVSENNDDIKFMKETYENILNSIDEGIHVADSNGIVRYINPAQEATDGYKLEEVLGKKWLDVYDLAENTSLVLEVLKNGTPILDRYQNYVTKNGRYVSIICSCLPLYSNGVLIGATAITKDYIKFKELAEKVLNIPNQSIVDVKRGKESSYYTFEDILGNNKQLLESIMMAKNSAKSESSVLIYGETGTGKEIFAQSIHQNSKRAKKPFLAINCAAIPENLLEGLLFGTTKGAFTGAVDRSGLLEQANGGTIFLDEINSMPLILQSKLLRVVEERKNMRLGSNKEAPIDVRFIASCNVEPSEAINKGQLRNDLFYRLAVIYLVIPPLRKRLDDLELLIDHFIKFYNNQMSKNCKGVSAQVLEKFYDYEWMGNVRQLKHCIESAMNIISHEEPYINEEHLPKYLRMTTTINKQIKNNNTNVSILDEIHRDEKERIIKALKKSKGNVAKAAADLGMSRQNLHYRLIKYNLK
ncbi:MAG: PAS domain S-box protein [Clostridiaceae bacterium]|nr:PAS domain S-box protein [Clostridiaceae bacterium]